MPFNKLTFSNKFSLFQPVQQVLTSAQSYRDPLKARVKLYDRSRSHLFAEYDMFDIDNSDIILQQLDITNSYINKNFTLSFANDDNQINEDKIGLGGYVKITGGKTEEEDHFIIGGYIMDTNHLEIADGLKDYQLVCEGEKAQLNRIITSFRRASSTVDNVTDPNIIRLPDSQMTIFNLINEFLTKTDARITKDFAIKDYYALDLSGISEDLEERILSISEQLQEATEPMNFFASLSNAFWDIEDGRVIFRHPDLIHSGIVLKNKVEASDRAISTSYFTDKWNFTDSIRKSVGHANGIYNLSSSDTKTVASNNINGGSTVQYRRANAQKFSAIDTRFTSIALIMSKIGNPFSNDTAIEKQVIKGEIRIDNNNRPDGPLVATFEIPISSITESVDTVFVSDIKLDESILSPNAEYWIILLPVGENLQNTVRWHHDGLITHDDPTHYSAFSAMADENSTPNWQISDIGPSYTYNVFAKIKRVQYYKDPDSEKKYGLTEDIVDFPEVEDPLSITRLMQSLIRLRSKPIRIYTANSVTIPNGKIFIPGQAITINDSTLRHETSKNIFAIIQEVRYKYDAYTENFNGLIDCEILPIGFKDFKIEELYAIP